MRRLALPLALALAAGQPAAARTAEEFGADRARTYLDRGDKHFMSAHYRLAAEAYRVALQYDPTNEELWEKHRRAFQMGRAIDGYVAKAEALMEKGLMEEAASFLRLAVKLNPRDAVLWRLYERALADNPHVVVVTTEREAWDAFRRGREVLDGGRYEAAIRYFEEVLGFTQDRKLKYYAESHLARAQEKLKAEYPNLPFRINDR